MALEGSIKDFSLADIFQLIGIQRKTGVLTLKHKDEEVKVSFLNGMVVNADSRSKRLDDRLGSVLVKTGKLSMDDLKKGLKLQKETLKKLGHILVEDSLVRPEDLREALNIQITQIIYRLFRWKDGDYHFEQDVSVDYDKENFTPMSAESILMEGMRMIDEWPIIERKISSFEMVFERVALADGAEPEVDDGTSQEQGGQRGGGDDFDLIFGGEKQAKPEQADERIKLTREENIVYQLVNGKSSVQEIVERTMLSEFETCRALYDLMNRNLIAPAVGGKKSAAGGKSGSRGLAVSGHLAKLGYAAIVAALLIVPRFWDANPLNVLTRPALASSQFQAYQRSVALARVRRVASAIDIYTLTQQAYPASVADLIAEGLLQPREAHDPWGRAIGFEVQSDRIRIHARTGPGEDAELVAEERLFQN